MHHQVFPAAEIGFGVKINRFFAVHDDLPGVIELVLAKILRI
jgi:hypothetical protein